MTALSSTNTLQAMGAMLVAAACFSVIPLLVALSGGSENPALFSGIWRIGALAGYGVFLWTFYRPLFNPATLFGVWRRVLIRRYRWLFLLQLASSADYALFALSARFIDLAATAVLFEVWPLAAMSVLTLLWGRSVKLLMLRVYPWAGFCLAGFILVAASPVGGFGGLFGGSGFSLSLAFGAGAAALAVLATSLSVCGFRLGWLLAGERELAELAAAAGVGAPLDRFGAVAVFMLSNFVSIPLSLGLGLTPAFGGTVSRLSSVWLAAGGLFLAAGAIFWQAANARSGHVGVNALGYLTPVFSLLLLWRFAGIGVLAVDYLIMGAGVLVAANLLVQFESARLTGLKAGVLGAGVFGMLVYLGVGV